VRAGPSGAPAPQGGTASGPDGPGRVPHGGIRGPGGGRLRRGLFSPARPHPAPGRAGGGPPGWGRGAAPRPPSPAGSPGLPPGHRPGTDSLRGGGLKGGAGTGGGTDAQFPALRHFPRSAHSPDRPPSHGRIPGLADASRGTGPAGGSHRRAGPGPAPLRHGG